jgi:hypothetical protein
MYIWICWKGWGPLGLVIPISVLFFVYILLHVPVPLGWSMLVAGLITGFVAQKLFAQSRDYFEDHMWFVPLLAWAVIWLGISGFLLFQDYMNFINPQPKTVQTASDKEAARDNDSRDPHSKKAFPRKRALSMLRQADFTVEGSDDPATLRKVLLHLGKTDGVIQSRLIPTHPCTATVIYAGNQTNPISITRPIESQDHVKFMLTEDQVANE